MKDLKRWYLTPKFSLIEPSIEDSDLMRPIKTTFSFKLSDLTLPPPLDFGNCRFISMEGLAKEQAEQRIKSGICNCGAPIHPDYESYCSDCG